jgi:hypothetical protein
VKLFESCPEEIVPQKCVPSLNTNHETKLISLYKTGKAKIQLKPAGGFELELISVADDSVLI